MPVAVSLKWCSPSEQTAHDCTISGYTNKTLGSGFKLQRKISLEDQKHDNFFLNQAKLQELPPPFNVIVKHYLYSRQGAYQLQRLGYVRYVYTVLGSLKTYHTVSIVLNGQEQSGKGLKRFSCEVRRVYITLVIAHTRD